MADEYTYKDPNADVLRAIDNVIIAAEGSNQAEYEYKNPDTDILHKIDELKDAVSGGGGGHTILDNSGTSLTQRSELQFKGAYSEDNSTDEVTEVNVVRSMTKAEFELLSANEKQGLINVTDVTGGGENEFQPVIYSETEREIGVWTDGKPLYQKTFSYSITSSLGDWTVFDDSVSYDVLVSAQGTISFSLEQTEQQVISSSPTADPRFEVKPDHKLYYYGTATRSGVVTLRYTKTTDTAGSGTWTPQGVPAVHYSETEQVVGTWIDGSTLYEKTFVFNSSITLSENWGNTSFDVPNGNIIIESTLRRYDNKGTISHCSNFVTNGNTEKIRLSTECNNTNIAEGSTLTIRYTKSSS